MTPEQFRAVLERHGGLMGHRIIDPQVDTTTTDRLTGQQTTAKAPNPSPRVRYTTKDGEITARQKDDGTFEVLEDPKGLVGSAPAGGVTPAQQNAAANAQRAQTTAAYDQARAAYLSGQLNRQNILAEAEAYRQRLQTMVALRQMEQKDADYQLEQWKAGVAAAQQERQLAISQQNANTSAGNLGVSRGQLGVGQEQADTQREAVIQSAASSAVDQTIRLMGQYMKVGPAFGRAFAAGINQLAPGMNIKPEDFAGSPLPSLDDIRNQAVTEAIGRLKGGFGPPAPATAAAIGQTAVPGAVTPAPVAPPPAPAPSMSAQGVLAAAGPPPALPGQAPLPPYTGPPTGVGPGNVQ